MELIYSGKFDSAGDMVSDSKKVGKKNEKNANNDCSEYEYSSFGERMIAEALPSR